LITLAIPVVCIRTLRVSIDTKKAGSYLPAFRN
jgi:hypothetical protein